MTAERTALDRVAQLHDKQRKVAAESERAAQEFEEMQRNLAKANERARVEAEARRRLAAEMRTAVQAQVVL
ncbi:zinc ribbon domain-containing protein, partial [archaeon]